MITDKGRELLVQYLAGKIDRWAAAIEVGVGETATQATDTSLEFPHLRFEVDNFDYDEVNKKVIVRATIPQEVATSVYEVGLFTSLNFPEPTIGNRLLLDYVEGSAIFVDQNVSLVSADSRIGNEARLISAGAGQTGFVRGYTEAAILSPYKGSDNFNLAYHFTNTGGVPTVTVRMETTESDYYEYTFNPSTGYNIETFAKSSLTTVGSPDWGTIDSVYISTDSQSDLMLDGIMIEESLIIESYGMVARRVLTTPRSKPAGVEAELTFEVGLTF